MLDETHDIVLLGGFDELLMVHKLLRCRFRNENVQSTLQSVQRNRIMGA